MDASRFGNCHVSPRCYATTVAAHRPVRENRFSMLSPLLYARTLLIGAAGGLVGYLLNLPLGWLVGAMLATIPCAMAGVRMPTSWRWRSNMSGVIGLMAGAAFTPSILQHMNEWAYSLAGVALYCLIITAIGLFFCRKIGGQDRVTAAFSAAPGGLSEIIVLGPSYGADMRTLSLVHSMRLTVILVMMPLILVWFVIGQDTPATAGRSINFTVSMPLADFAILAACLVLGIMGGRKIRLPAAPLTGPLILSAIAHYTGLTAVAPPQLLLIAAQIVIGSSVAQFFAATSLRTIAGGLAVGGGLTVVNLAVAALFAFGFETWLGIPFATGLIALVPGGLPEMSLISIALGADVPFVTVHHMFRVVLVLFLLPILAPIWAGSPKSA